MPEYHNSCCTCRRCRRRYAQACDGSGADPRCETTTPHRHCACMLPMGMTDEQCQLCVLEGTVPLNADQMEWDGVTYASLRRNRTRAPEPEVYERMFRIATGLIRPAQRAFQ